MMEQNKKICPYCGEEIMAAAKKCRHCGEWLEAVEKSSDQSHTLSMPKSKNDNNAILKYSVLAIAVILIAVSTYDIASKSDNEEASGQAASEIEEIDTIVVDEAVEVEPTYNNIQSEYDNESDGANEWE